MKKNYINPVVKVFSIETDSIIALSGMTETDSHASGSGNNPIIEDGESDAAGYRNSLWN